VVAAASGADQPKSPLQGFHDAATEYSTALAQVSSRLQDRLQRAQDDLAHAASPAAPGSATDELNNAQRDVLAACQDQDWEKIKTIQTSYLSRVQAHYADAETAARGKLSDYANAVQAAWQDARSEALAAFQKHVGSVKDSFANLSVEHADPAALATIAHSLAAVAAYAHNAAQTAAVSGPPPKT
jgi:O6-methylguanine-DNA--protein-cysteine methyltransferase